MARPNKWKVKFPITRKPGRATEHLVTCPSCDEQRWLKASDITKLHGEPICRGCSVEKRWHRYRKNSQRAAERGTHIDGTAITNCIVCAIQLNTGTCHKNTFNLGKEGYRLCKACIRTLRAERRKPYREKDAARARKSRETDWAKWLLRQAKRRERDFEIDEDWIHARFLAQGEKCFWTGVQMTPSSDPNHALKPSLDRLDRSRGYRRDNVVLTALCVNLGRNEASEKQMREFLDVLKNSVIQSTPAR